MSPRHHCSAFRLLLLGAALVSSGGCRSFAQYDEAKRTSDAGVADLAGDGRARDGRTSDGANTEVEIIPGDSGPINDAPRDLGVADTRPVDNVPQLLSGLTPIQDSRIGTAVAVSGEWIAVGQPGAEGDTTLQPRVNLWHCPGGRCSWKQGFLKSEGSRFGVSLAMAAGRLVVGAPGLGRFFIYQLSGTTWVPGPDVNSTSPDAQFGAILAMDAAHLAVGYKPSDGTGRVAIYAFGPPLTVMDTLISPSSSFGDALALAGDTLLIGYPSLDGGVGGVELFELKNTDWVQADTLQPTYSSSPPDTGSECGSSVTISGNLLVFACRKHYEVFPFEWGNNRWDALPAISPQATAPLTVVDYQVALSDGVLLIGTPYRQVNNVASGDVVVMQKTLYTPGWNGPRYRHLEPPQAGARFGQAVAIDGTLAVAGAPDYLFPGTSTTGGAFVFLAWP